MTDEQAKLHQFCRDSDVKSVISKFVSFLRDYSQKQYLQSVSLVVFSDGSGHIQTQEGNMTPRIEGSDFYYMDEFRDNNYDD
jgi:hypothetical protein